MPDDMQSIQAELAKASWEAQVQEWYLEDIGQDMQWLQEFQDKYQEDMWSSKAAALEAVIKALKESLKSKKEQYEQRFSNPLNPQDAWRIFRRNRDIAKESGSSAGDTNNDNTKSK